MAVVIDPGDPWLDIDGDGVRQPEEGLIAFLATVAPAPRGTTLQPAGRAFRHRRCRLRWPIPI
ncbi:MAG: hypothetical protein JKP98_07610 [Rhodobacteraceae bacterium]|nr:hypothetical protein [Paracoccaceae bacterium]